MAQGCTSNRAHQQEKTCSADSNGDMYTGKMEERRKEGGGGEERRGVKRSEEDIRCFEDSQVGSPYRLFSPWR